MAEEIITSTNAETATDHEYNASEIQVLKGLEAVRKRPGMYIGSTGERGLHHLVYEIVDNAIDEALAGYCDHIEVKILKGDIIQVTDNGRGIPVDIQADTGLPAVTVVYTILHAGGKFGGENSGYKVAGGLHGVGASVVNACSEWLTVNVRRDGREYEQTFRRGDPDGPLKCIGTVDPSVTGTRVTFKPDPEMFKDTTVYNFETLEKRLSSRTVRRASPPTAPRLCATRAASRASSPIWARSATSRCSTPTSSISRVRPTGAWQKSPCSIILATMSCC